MWSHGRSPPTALAERHNRELWSVVKRPVHRRGTAESALGRRRRPAGGLFTTPRGGPCACWATSPASNVVELGQTARAYLSAGLALGRGLARGRGPESGPARHGPALSSAGFGLSFPDGEADAPARAPCGTGTFDLGGQRVTGRHRGARPAAGCPRRPRVCCGPGAGWCCLTNQRAGPRCACRPRAGVRRGTGCLAASPRDLARIHPGPAAGTEHHPGTRRLGARTGAAGVARRGAARAARPAGAPRPSTTDKIRQPPSGRSAGRRRDVWVGAPTRLTPA
jgi:hypothetical protein